MKPTAFIESKLFLIASGEEEEFAKALKVLIEQWLPGVEVRYNTEKQRRAVDYKAKLVRDLEESAAVMFLLSQNFKDSPCCHFESAAAILFDRIKGAKFRHLQILVLRMTLLRSRKYVLCLA
jgi:hypothetical protein